MRPLIALNPEIEAIRSYCKEKGIHIFRGQLDPFDLSSCLWEGENHSDWRQFIDLAKVSQTSFIHLHISKWEYGPESIDELVSLIDDPELTLELVAEAKARQGEASFIELSFIYNLVAYSFEMETEWSRLISEADDQDNDLEETNEEPSIEHDEETIQSHFQQLIALPEFKQTKTTADRYRLAFELVRDGDDDRRSLGFKIAALGDIYFKESIQEGDDKEKVAKLRRMRDENPKLTKVEAEAALGVSKRHFQRLWLRAFKEE